MRNVLLCVISALFFFMACDKPDRGVGSSFVAELKSDDGSYRIVCDKINEDDFRKNFQVGWRCEEIYDVFADGTKGEGYSTITDGGSGGPLFSIISDNQLRAYFIFRDSSGDHYTYSDVTYTYGEGNNELKLSGEISRFEGGIVMSLTKEEMCVAAKLWMPQWAAEGAVYSLFVFRKLTKGQIEEMESVID